MALYKDFPRVPYAKSLASEKVIVFMCGIEVG